MNEVGTPSHFDLGPPPRVVRLKRWYGLVKVLYFLLLMVPVCVGALAGIQYHVFVHGTPIQAKITDSYITQQRKGGAEYHVVYRYSMDGSEQVDEEAVDWKTYQDYPPEVAGRAMNLWGHYFSVTELINERQAAERALVICGIWILMIAVTPWWIWVRMKRLVAHGQTAVATVTNKRKSFGKSTSYVLDYTFNSPDGAVVAGLTVAPRKKYDVARVGDQITVLFDPRRPKRNVAYEFGIFEVVRG
jgi:hypothetical protein